jgi:hypothetical protein
MRESQVNLILHLGQHKTGSKALQSALAHNQKVLAKNGIYYPNLNPKHPVIAYQISHFKLFSLLRYQAMKEVGDEKAESFWKIHHEVAFPDQSPEDLFKKLYKEAVLSNSHTLILSAEDVFDMHTAQEVGFNPELIVSAARQLKSCCEHFGFVPHLLIYLRRQDYLAVAHYNQYVKGTAYPELDFDSYLRLFFPRLKTFSILRYWREAFGDKAIQIRPYEKSTLPNGIVSDFFTHVLKRPFPQAWRASPKTIETVNATPPRDYLEFILAQKKLGLSRGQFPQELILQEALKHHREGLLLEEWFSPESQQHLLDQLKVENENLREFYSEKKEDCFFMEPAASVHQAWQSYPGFSASKAIEIAREVHASSIETRRKNLKQKIKKAVIGLAFSALIGALSVWLYCYFY